ncbi:mitochondrial import inner membrane translocase subunit tim16 isoform X1 [Leucoraja erinacea]|uniref:mitochondrial import inner membrane translocase subunit tim16 isoform X1 n=1 Tax=Leucoraja erinaceus TaxID=7782 RepID=UPI0024587F09|nr:mitochondrial import inner membrane translocase subunit tim16 isoform X1 [Leucoraja erinacea]
MPARQRRRPGDELGNSLPQPPASQACRCRRPNRYSTWASSAQRRFSRITSICSRSMINLWVDRFICNPRWSEQRKGSKRSCTSKQWSRRGRNRPSGQRHDPRISPPPPPGHLWFASLLRNFHWISSGLCSVPC